MVSGFAQQVYSLCKQVPKGKVTTYGEIARVLKSKGFQAVGQVLHKNPFAPVVPCHRVVNSKGELHGFAFGLGTKKKMLES
ncbi:MAG: MGMT family protein, partial [Nanoarchaeota archaeon]|nr:MGMT family protein [Nanoarchaeota archaeon]